MDKTPPAQASCVRSTPDAILDVTIALLAEVGTAGTTFDRIVERASLSSKRLITYHFGTRELLFGRVVERVGTAAEARIGPAVRSAPSWRAKLRAFIEGNVAFIRDEPASIAAVQSIMWASPAKVGEMVAGTVEVLAQIIALGQQAGEFRPIDARLAATSVRGAIDAAIPLITSPAVADCGPELAELFDRALAAGGAR